MSGLMLLATAVSASSGVRIDPTALLMWLTCIVTVGGALITGIKYGRPILTMARDFNGERERPGVPHRLGVMERLAQLDEQVAVVHKEVNYNHGGSIKDAVERISQDVKSLHDRLDTKPEQGI